MMAPNQQNIISLLVIEARWRCPGNIALAGLRFSLWPAQTEKVPIIHNYQFPEIFLQAKIT